VLTSTFTTRFKKERKLLKKRGWDMDKLTGVMRLIVAEQPLPERCRPHPLHGGWVGYTECHVENDWLLIYKINTAHTEVLFDRTGSHSDLF
jgi:mRNA interferase YafQ